MSVELLARLAGQSHYQVLGVAPGAGEEEIRAAFGALSMRYHPDRQGLRASADEKRVLVSIQARLNQAYRTLTDPRRRGEYDRGLAGHAAEDPANPNARRFFALGVERERARDPQGALFQYRLAQQIEPESEAIRAALARFAKP